MTRFNITDVLYEEIAERCADNVTFTWDCIELNDGFAVVFACKNGKPYDVEVRNEDDDIVSSDFSLARYDRIAANL